MMKDKSNKKIGKKWKSYITGIITSKFTSSLNEADKYFHNSISESTAKAIRENWIQILGVDYEIICMNLYRNNQPLGIALEGRNELSRDAQELIPHHYLKSIKPTFCIGLTHKFMVKDELLEINGLKVIGLSADEVLSALHKLTNYFQIVVGRSMQHNYDLINGCTNSEDNINLSLSFCCMNEDESSRNDTLRSVASNYTSTNRDVGSSVSLCSMIGNQYENVKEYLRNIIGWRGPIIIEFSKQKENLGLSIEQIPDPKSSNMIIVFKFIVHGMTADKDGRLHTGDRLLEVNGKSVHGVSFRQVCKWMKSPLGKRLVLSICKPHFEPNNSDAYNSKDSNIYFNNTLRDEDELSKLSQETACELIEIPPLPEHLEKKITLKRSENKLGVSLDITENGKNGVRIKKIGCGIVKSDGRLKEGDYLTEICGVSLRVDGKNQLDNCLKRIFADLQNCNISFVTAEDINLHISQCATTSSQRKQSVQPKESISHIHSDQSSIKLEQTSNVCYIIERVMNVKDDSDNSLNSLIEEVFLVTIERDCTSIKLSSHRPKYLYFIGESFDHTNFNIENIEQIIFERLILTVDKHNVLEFENGYNIDIELVIDDSQINYLFNCYIRISKLLNKPVKYSKNHMEIIMNTIFVQARLFIGNSVEIVLKDVGIQLYNCISNNSTETECLKFFTELFQLADQNQSETHSHPLYFQEFFQYFLTQTFCNKPPPVSNILGIWKDPLQTLYCPERKNFVLIMNILCSIPIAAEMILDFSSQNKKGIDFERCLLGRFLCSTHLPAGIMQSAEFFNKMPITIQEKQVEEQTIWQLTKASLSDSCEIFMNIFQAARYRPEIRTKLLTWFGQCIHLNKCRNQLVHSLNSIPTQGNQLASDGFFMNFTIVLFHIAKPLISPPFEKIFTVQLEFTDYKELNEFLLPGLCEETRLVPTDETIKDRSKIPEKITVLTQLFYLVHKSYQLSFHVIHGRFMELNQQLHRIQEVYEDLLNGGASNSAEGEQLKKMMTSQMSQYMSLNSAMRQPEFMMKSFALIVASCRLLVKIGKFHNLNKNSSQLSLVPEFVMDNIVDFLTFLRHFDDSFFETSGFSLDSILEMVVLYMGSVERMKNPHLRSKIATLLECLIPQRDETASTQGGSITFYLREQLFSENGSWTHDMIMEALFSAFTTMELSIGQENVRFEEKFEYRRPMYACMRYFYKKPKFDNQIRKLEKNALDNINNSEAPLCLKFLNLLINDATYLLDEALNYLGQLKTKEVERMKQGGKFTNQTEEGNFQHMVMLAKYHNSLATDTIDQLNRMATLCPTILTHPILIDRIACTLNYFLDHLVGPKRSNLTVMNKEAYAFRPKQIVKIIAEIYVSLGDKPEFCNAVVNDGRSYSNKLLETATNLMGKVSSGMDLYSKFEDLTNRLKVYSANQNEENENFEDAPEEYLDPIMGTVMRDPVILPSSGINVDRKTIFRHLLSDTTDPFNRQPLTMADVKSNEELKVKIVQWIETQKRQQ